MKFSIISKTFLDERKTDGIQKGLSMNFSRSILAWVITVFSIAGCSQTMSMTIDKIEARSSEISIDRNAFRDIKTIAVFTFSNSHKTDCGAMPSVCPEPKPLCTYPYLDDGKVLSGRVARTLMTTYGFNILEQDSLENLRKEKLIRSSEVTDTQNVIEIGKILGVDALLVGKVKACRYTTHYNCLDDQITQPMGDVKVSLKMISTLTGKVIMLADGELSSYNLLDGPLVMEYSNILDNPYYYSSQIPNLDIVINRLVEDLTMPLVENK